MHQQMNLDRRDVEGRGHIGMFFAIINVFTCAGISTCGKLRLCLAAKCVAVAILSWAGQAARNGWNKRAVTEAMEDRGQGEKVSVIRHIEHDKTFGK